MGEPLVRLNRRGAKATVVLNRPEHGNACTRAMLAEATQMFEDLRLERGTRAVVLTGAGDAFCRGADQDEIDAARSRPRAMGYWQEEAEAWLGLIETLLRFPKPVVAAVGGPAESLGACLALAADVVVAAEGATFSVADPRAGAVCGLAAPLLAFRAGGGAAGYLLLGCRTIDAAHALRLGIYHETAPAEHVWVRAAEIADDLASCSPSALLLTKRLLNESVAETLLCQLAAGAAALATSRTMEDATEALEARRAGRPPKWI